MARAAVIPVGDVFGRWTVLGRGAPQGKRKAVIWTCRCACGAVKDVAAGDIARGCTQSCGCLQSDLNRARQTTHGQTHSPEYQVWAAMKSRCTNPRNHAWAGYGGRGITVCDRWRDDFAAFLADMGPRPSPKHSIDRIDNDGPYSPENCRWATRTEQCRNQRSNRVVAHGDRTQCLAAWAAEIGVAHSLLSKRLRRGWSIAATLATPSGSRRSCTDRSFQQST